MPNYVQINSISGTPPYTIFVCDQTFTYCFLVAGPITITTPYIFMVPSPLTNVTDLIVQIYDSNGCETWVALSCGTYYGKEYEDFEIFLFQDASIYLFEGP
jgi:hypothetical protein